MAEKGLLPSVTTAIRILEIISVTATVSGSLFIITANLQERITNKFLKLSDQLITWISVSNVSYGLIRFIMFIIKMNFPGALSFQLRIQVYMIFNFTFISYNLWLCTWLCVYMCLKILNLQKRFYITLQNVLSAISPWIPILSLRGSLLLSLPFFWHSSGKTQAGKLTGNCSQNASVVQDLKKSLLSAYVIYGIVSSLAFLILSTSALSIIISLCRHMKNMKDNAEGLRSASVKIHVHAVKNILSLLSLNIFMFVSAILALIKFSKTYIMHACAIATYIGLVLSPVILIKAKSNLSLNLIAGNAILNKALRDVLKNCLCSQCK
uniref:Taste receptor type 2 n=1 Tax=Leptobrachium leishanense TaxID=445787 RepID=A0A8C5WML9_9ANUR